MKTKLFLIFLMCLSAMAFGQQEPQYTQYMYNTMAVNPAYAGSRGALDVFLLHRAQWLGFDGAPVTTNFSIDSPVSENIGVGVSLMKDKIGPSSENDLAANLSYGFYINEIYRLSFGLRVSANVLDIDFSNTHVNDLNDYAFETNIDNRFSPNIGAGVYLNSDNSYIGISSPAFLKSEHFDRYAEPNASSHVINKQMHLYLMGGYVFDLSDNVKFKPSFLSKLTSGAPVQVDLSANFLMNDKICAGLAYRWNAALSALVGFQATNNWFIGYSYDMETTRLANYNSGSHEIFLRYELFNKYNRYVVSPRFF
ncbi:type IX secretion system membrane protein PorP/SprF [Flavobacterium humidisoli]|uniref:Type IX secretion system membrane protein PorP/SprF n=1 Tax=Flavobacterium humidisoli TaxID=2937442 RepID=A0ABY4LXV6_9FLAO|nr:type IX secretion system membrane protein PorP/SprF [Flavobacterium humidisoli]UPZ17880.1 type IX secretion system membrane protein PorP/SprF [Flavobacterium humidisoli]